MAKEYAVEITAADRARTASVARSTTVAGKGRGVVAVRALPAMTLIGPYPGERRTAAQFADGGGHGKFAVDFFRPGAGGRLLTRYVIDPGDGAGGLAPRFAHAVTPLVNEPGPGERPNLVWAWNLPKYRLEMWTLRAVRPGEELTVCYGTGGGYRRGYATSCVSRQQEVEPVLHVVSSPGTRPVPYSSLGDAGVRRALLALLGRQLPGGPA